MHGLPFEQGAETQISCVVQLLPISEDNRANYLGKNGSVLKLSDGRTGKNYNHM